MILEITASTNGGFCGSCVKTRGMRYRLGQVKALCYFLGGLLVLPFGIAVFFLRNAWRRWRFPFDRSALLVAIRKVYGDTDVASSYLDGVVDGYWESTPEAQPGFTSNRAHRNGMEDGGRMRRGVITASQIPTSRGTLTELTKMPHLKLIKYPPRQA